MTTRVCHTRGGERLAEIQSPGGFPSEQSLWEVLLLICVANPIWLSNRAAKRQWTP